MWLCWIPISPFLVWILVDPVEKIYIGSIIPLDLSEKIYLGSMIPSDSSANLGVRIYDPIGSQLQTLGIGSWDPFLGSVDMSALTTIRPETNAKGRPK